MEIAIWRHGWWVVAAPLAVVLAASMYFAALAPAKSSLAATRTELSREMAASTGKKKAAPPATEAQRIADLQAVLDVSPDPAQVVRRMVVLAKEEQIQLAQSDYQSQVHPGIGVTQVSITQPVRATYGQLRRYIESVLREMPNASLDQVSARRENVSQSQLEVRLRWSIWMRKAP